jgi:hypothetical protein
MDEVTSSGAVDAEAQKPVSLPPAPSPPDGTGRPGSLSRLLKHRYLPWALVSLLLLGVIAVAATRPKDQTSEVQSLQSSLSAVKSQRDSVTSDVSNLQGQVSNLQSQVTQAEKDAQTAFRRAMSRARTQLRSRFAALRAQSAALVSRKKTLDKEAAAVGLRQQFIRSNSFGDGLFKVGTDIKAGSYHANGGPNCYWAELRSSDTTNIITNNISSGPQTVTISSPYFESDGCGTWVPA